MSANILVLHPNQLFEKKFILLSRVVLYEHPDFFTKYKFNKLKLILHRTSMKLYQKYLQKEGYNVAYREFNGAPPKGETLFQPNSKTTKKTDATLESPNFLCIGLFEKYRQKTDKFFFNNFYMYMKESLNIMPKVKSQDKNNRQKMKNEHVPQYKLKLSSVEKSELLSAIEYVRRHFKNNPGPEWEDIYKNWNLPFTRGQAKSQMNFFLKNKIKNFGPFQDYMRFGQQSEQGKQNEQNNNLLFHSFLSSSLNIGILHPSDLLAILDLKIPLNSKEGFIRQLFWREYQLYCYRYADLSTRGNKYDGKKSLNLHWYDGTVGMLPVDLCIKKAFKTGYLHHIERLMVMGNFMLLYGIRPSAAFRWFMEFSVDSYEWVMYQNVLDMVFNVSGGKTMRRIYISSSNYILKMSDLAKGSWCDEWDELFRAFVSKNKISYPYNSK